MLTKTLTRALEILKTYPGGATCSMIGLRLYPARTASCNRAREGGAVLRRLLKIGLAEREPTDSHHTLWVAKPPTTSQEE